MTRPRTFALLMAICSLLSAAPTAVLAIEGTPAPLLAAATAPDVWALYRQAESYETGKGVPRSWKKARALYERVLVSADRKAAGFAAFALGNHYLKPGSRNWARAAGYFRKGDALGEPWSVLKLGEMHEKGQGMKRSARRARAFYERAAEASDTRVRMYAHAALGRLYSNPPLRNTSKAIAELEAALQLGEYWSAYTLAELYAKRKRTDENRTRIRQMLGVLLESGDPKARKAAIALSRKLGIS